jgi:hypothetical protein
VLYGSDPHHRARLFAFIAKLRGWKVQASDSFEEAVTWLSEAGEPQVETEFTPKVKKVPVRQLKALKASAKPAAQPAIIVKSPPRAAVAVKADKKKPASIRANISL